MELFVAITRSSRTPRFTGPARRRWTMDEPSAAPAPVQPLVRRRSSLRPARVGDMLKASPSFVIRGVSHSIYANMGLRAGRPANDGAPRRRRQILQPPLGGKFRIAVSY